MKNRQFSNEKGMTLIELLASLGLVAVIIVLSSSAIIQLIKDESRINDGISHQQEMNITVSDLRSQYYQGNQRLCITTEEPKFSFTELVNLQPVSEDCIEVVDSAEPISFSLSGTTSSNQEYSVQTALVNNRTLQLEPVLFKDVNPDYPRDYQEGNIYMCEFNKDTKFSASVDIQDNGNSGSNRNTSSLSIKGNGDNKNICNGIYTFHKNVAFLQDLHIKNHNRIEVSGDMYVFEKLDVDNNASIHVAGNLYIRNNYNIGKQADIDIKGKVCRIKDESNIKKCDIEIDI
ncbi:PulJ/GspJ family protein [Oceanobacillus massiliensis]|uniref:PulJ/GspJ family protein n=1 Tax=Oceanobacillus massiliensis TaxID=1465765 RepID=UPI0002889AFC|nr:type II secretion system protein [Oceanobacillus massiliensis]